eukprot:Pgem_evm2s13422
MKQEIIKCQEQGMSTSCIAINKKVVGLVGLTDRIKPGTKTVMDFLRKIGLKTFIVTGDNQRTADAV